MQSFLFDNCTSHEGFCLSELLDQPSGTNSEMWYLMRESSILASFGDVVPDEGEFNLGYFEGKQHTKKWLVTSQDLEAMYRENHVFIYGVMEKSKKKVMRKGLLKRNRDVRVGGMTRRKSSKMFFNN